MSARSRVHAFPVGVAGAIGLLLAVPGRAQSVSELLDTLEKKRNNIDTLHHVTKTVVEQNGRTRTSIVRTWEKRVGQKRRFRLESSMEIAGGGGKPVEASTTTTVADGTHEWREMVVGDKTMVFKSKAAKRDPFHRLRLAQRSGTLRFTGRELMHRQPCIVLQGIMGERGQTSKATFWVSESHGVVMKSVQIKKQGPKTEMTTSAFAVNEPIEDAKFTYRPPDGTTVLDADNVGGKTGGKSQP